MNIDEIQHFLTEKRGKSQRKSKNSRRTDRDSKSLDGWLLYDFRGSNPIARRVTGIMIPVSLDAGSVTFLQRVPRYGSSTALKFPTLRMSSARSGPSPIGTNFTANWARFSQTSGRVAMEYSPFAAIPYVSRVDAGTVELIRSLGVEVASSADLVQLSEARWTADQFAGHQKSAHLILEIKDEGV